MFNECLVLRSFDHLHRTLVSKCPEQFVHAMEKILSLMHMGLRPRLCVDLPSISPSAKRNIMDEAPPILIRFGDIPVL
jgi:hypothetical protein